MRLPSAIYTTLLSVEIVYGQFYTSTRKTNYPRPNFASTTYLTRLITNDNSNDGSIYTIPVQRTDIDHLTVTRGLWNRWVERNSVALMGAAWDVLIGVVYWVLCTAQWKVLI